MYEKYKNNNRQNSRKIETKSLDRNREKFVRYEDDEEFEYMDEYDDFNDDIIKRKKHTDKGKVKREKKEKQLQVTDSVINKYTTLKIIPDRGIGTNQRTFHLAKALYSLLDDNTMKLLKREDGSTVRINKESKISFLIDLTNDNVSFIFIVPTDALKVFKEKLYEVFPNIGIEELIGYDLPEEKYEEKYEEDKKKKLLKSVNKKSDCLYQSLSYKYNDILSLNVENNLSALEDLISNQHWLEDGDRVVVIYNFTGVEKKEFDKKRNTYKTIIEKTQEIDSFKLLNNKVSVEYVFGQVYDGLFKGIEFVYETIEGIMGESDRIIKEKQNKAKVDVFSICNQFTKEKAYTSQKLGNEIVIVSKSSNSNRRFENMKLITESFGTLFCENQLEEHNTIRPKLYDTHLGNKKNIMSLKEISKFLLLPDRGILTENQNIEQVKVKQGQSTEWLEKGVFNIGLHSYRDKEKQLFLPADYNSESLGYVQVGPMGVGKTSYFANLIKNAVDNGQSNVIIDYIGACELSQAVLNNIDKSKAVVIDVGSNENLISLEFNEFNLEENCSDVELLLKAITQKAEATEKIIDSLNSHEKLTANMSRIIQSVCNIVYMKQHRNFGDVIRFLSDHNYRTELINEVKNKEIDNIIFNMQMNESLNVVEQLNEYSTEVDNDGYKYKVVTGTNMSKINGIMARINRIKKGYILPKMLYDSKAMNFVELLDAGKTIIIKMQDGDVSEDEKNVISTFITMKTVLATKARKGKVAKPNRSNLWIDEPHQVETVQEVFHKQVCQLRKYGLKANLCVHSLSQLNKDFQRALLEAGTSFSLLAGSQIEQIEEFKGRLGEFKVDDILNMKPYHAFHIIRNTGKGYWTGITQLPPELK